MIEQTQKLIDASERLLQLLPSNWLEVDPGMKAAAEALSNAMEEADAALYREKLT